MLVDDHAWKQPEPWGHAHVANAIRSRPLTSNQHGLAHRRSPCRCAGNHPTCLVNLVDVFLYRRVADLTGDTELVATGEKHGLYLRKLPELFRSASFDAI